MSSDKRLACAEASLRTHEQGGGDESPTLRFGPIRSAAHGKGLDRSALEFSCGNQPGPVPDALKSAFAKALRAQGLIVVMKKPSREIFDEISVSLMSNELPSNPPIIPKRFVCDVMGGLTRLGPAGKLIQLKELEFHNKEVHPVSEIPSSLVEACFMRAAVLVKECITAMNQPQNNNDQ